MLLELGWNTVLEHPSAVSGLERIRFLELFNVRSLRLDKLLRYDVLEHLKIVGGPVCAWQVLPRFRSLRYLYIGDCYDLSPESFPAASDLPPFLEKVVFHGLRKTEAEELLQRLSGYTGRLLIGGRRDDAWVRAHHDNPFRDWEARGEGCVADIAAEAYRKASKALDRLGPSAGPAQVRRVLHRFVEKINRIGGDLDMIRRKELVGAYGELAGRVPRAQEAAVEWLAEWRNF
jgi:hypothetical protein